MEEKNFKLIPEIYDLQVNWERRLDKERDFFVDIFRKNNIRKVLDIGCGTGHHAQLFSEFAEKVVAIDPSEEAIEFAGEKVVKSPDVILVKEGFEGLEKISGGPFDMITVLGNTLPILGNRRKVKQALKKMRNKLAENGLAVIQFLNFNSNVMEENRFYPPKMVKKNGRNYIFIKHFEYGKIKTRVDFLITIICGDEIEDFFVNSSHLCTLNTALFIKMARNAGFKSVELLGPGGKRAFKRKKDISLYALMRRK